MRDVLTRQLSGLFAAQSEVDDRSRATGEIDDRPRQRFVELGGAGFGLRAHDNTFRRVSVRRANDGSSPGQVIRSASLSAGAVVKRRTPIPFSASACQVCPAFLNRAKTKLACDGTGTAPSD